MFIAILVAVVIAAILLSLLLVPLRSLQAVNGAPPSGEQRSRRERQISFVWFLMPRLAQPDARSTSVLVDELDAGGF
jgi:hypothetical protein